MNDNESLDALLADLPPDALQPAAVADVPARPSRDLPKMMRKIPVTLTLDVGEARLSLLDLMAIDTDSVIELDTLAGEPLILKANGTVIGRAEVVVSGENYGLKVVEIAGLDLDSLAP
jgi:flagellar motor switch protein FliN/FliY